MTIVVDASVLVAAVLDGGSKGDWALGVLDEHAPMAPHLVHVEVANVLRRVANAGTVPEAAATAAHAHVLALAIDLFPYEPFSDRIWELRGAVSSYDAWYVALAESFRVPLATLDRRLVSANGPRCTFLHPDARPPG